MIVQCQHNINGLCQIATDISKIPTVAHEATCYACSTQPNPCCENKVTQGLALASILRQNRHDKDAALNHPSNIVNKLANSKQTGPGTTLKKLISWFPIGKEHCSRCSELEEKMNQWGPDKCLEQMSYILHYMEVTAKQKKILWNHTAVRLLVLTAIRLNK